MPRKKIMKTNWNHVDTLVDILNRIEKNIVGENPKIVREYVTPHIAGRRYLIKEYGIKEYLTVDVTDEYISIRISKDNVLRGVATHYFKRSSEDYATPGMESYLKKITVLR